MLSADTIRFSCTVKHFEVPLLTESYVLISSFNIGRKHSNSWCYRKKRKSRSKNIQLAIILPASSRDHTNESSRCNASSISRWLFLEFSITDCLKSRETFHVQNTQSFIFKNDACFLVQWKIQLKLTSLEAQPSAIVLLLFWTCYFLKNFAIRILSILKIPDSAKCLSLEILTPRKQVYERTEGFQSLTSWRLLV